MEYLIVFIGLIVYVVIRNKKTADRNASLRSKIKEEFLLQFDGHVTTKDIVFYAFTLPGVIGVAVYNDVFIQAIFVKTEPLPVNQRKNISLSITDFINNSKTVYPLRYRIDINGREGRAKNLSRITTIDNFAQSLGIKL